MHLNIAYKNLSKIAAFAGQASKAGNDPITKSVILNTVPDGFKIGSMGIEMWGHASAEAEVFVHGQQAVNGEFFSKTIQALPLGDEDLIEVADAGSEIEIRTLDGKYHRQIPCVALDDFSGRPSWVGPLIDVDVDFTETLSIANRAAGDITSRPTLAGVHVHPEGLIATDSYQFIVIDQEYDLEFGVTIPSFLIKTLPDPSTFGHGNVRFGTSPTKIAFDFGGNQIVGVTIATEYPSVELIKNLFPEMTTPYFIEIEVAELKKLLEALRPMTDDLTGATIFPDSTIVVVSPDNSMAKDKIEAVHLEIEQPISFRLSHLTQVRGLMKSEETCTFRFNQTNPTAAPFTVTKDNLTLGFMPIKTI